MCRERQPPTPVPSVCVRARWRHACVESTRRNSACAALIMMRTFCRQRAPFPQAVSGSMMIFLSCRWVVARIRERIPEKKPGTVQLDALLHRWTLLSCAILCEAWRSRAPARPCPHQHERVVTKTFRNKRARAHSPRIWHGHTNGQVLFNDRRKPWSGKPATGVRLLFCFSLLRLFGYNGTRHISEPDYLSPKP